MARYLAVVPLQTEGKPVSLDASVTGSDDQPSVPPGMRLAAVVNNGEWQSALDVTFPSVYQNLRDRCRAGIWKEMQLYLIGEERSYEIEDARRVLMNGQPVKEPRRRH
jgi:hypothetical protein